MRPWDRRRAARRARNDRGFPAAGRHNSRTTVLRGAFPANERLHVLPDPPRLRRGLIGVAVFDAAGYGPAAVLRGVEQAARQAGHGICIVRLESLDRAGVLEAAARLAAQQVLGMVFIAPLASTVMAGAAPAAVPVVAVGADGAGPVPGVSPDHGAGARLAVDHLLKLGHETVWHLSGPRDWPESRRRASGWRGALEAAGRRVPPLLAGPACAQGGYEVGRMIAGRDEVTALFCADDRQALGVLRALAERGVRIPDEVSVVGYDDMPEAEFLTPSLTTVRQGFGDVGRRCLATLLAMIGEPVPPACRHLEPGPALIVRASTGPPR